jgi:hypothetical protein
MTTTAEAPGIPAPDAPVPFTLTPKGRAEVDGFPPVVCLCGSTRFHDEFRRANLRLTLAGQIVLSIGCDAKSDGDLPAAAAGDGGAAAVKARLDALHKRKIDLADYVLVLNVGGYVGESTRSEIDYARAAGKPVRYLDPFAVPGDLRPGEWACTACGAAWCGYQPGDGACAGCRPSADERAAAGGGPR